MSKSKYITIFIPTFNGESYLHECIEAVLAQVLPKGYDLELLVTDSGSSDGSIDILKSFGNKLKLNYIPNSEFGHGKTRQLAAIDARGEFILFLSQDATPASHTWLKEMIEPFFVSDNIGCVFGKQIPRPDTAPTIKREVSEVFSQFGPDDAIMIHTDKSLIDGRPYNSYNYFFSDVNSAVRRSLVVDSVPFRDVQYAEDQALAQDMFKKGYTKAYSSRGAVWHANMYSYKQYYYRKFDEYTGLQESVDIKLLPSKKELMLGWIKPTIHDWIFTIKDPDYSTASKLYWAFISPLYNINNFRGKYNAIKYINNDQARNKNSLESRTKKT